MHIGDIAGPTFFVSEPFPAFTVLVSGSYFIANPSLVFFLGFLSAVSSCNDAGWCNRRKIVPLESSTKNTKKPNTINKQYLFVIPCR
jgi:hypothetical protein